MHTVSAATPEPGVAPTLQLLGVDFSCAPSRRKPITVARGHIDRGLPSIWREVHILGLTELRRSVARKVRAGVEMQVGDVFTAESYTSSLAAIRTALAEGGYA